MVLRSFRRRSLGVQLLILLLIAVFFVVCGLHLAAAHHDGDADGLVFGATILALLSLVVIGLGIRRDPYDDPSSVDRGRFAPVPIVPRPVSLSEGIDPFLPLLI
ncbi:MAG: hypothetical protein ACLGHL_07355 [Actinomycetota bacterium]